MKSKIFLFLFVLVICGGALGVYLLGYSTRFYPPILAFINNVFHAKITFSTFRDCLMGGLLLLIAGFYLFSLFKDNVSVKSIVFLFLCYVVGAYSISLGIDSIIEKKHSTATKHKVIVKKQANSY